MDLQKYLNGQKRLWALTAINGRNEITASGWNSSIDKKPFSEEEMKEFTDNVFLKLQPHLKESDCRVLEVGVGSGLILQKIAPKVTQYDAVDISQEILEKCREFAAEKCSNVRFFQMFANEIEVLNENYDIIIVNSVMEYFPNVDYACNFLEKCRNQLRGGGVIFCGDIMDLEKKDDMVTYVSARGSVQHNFDKCLFFNRSFFFRISEELSFSKCEITEKIYAISNELSLFRFDVLLHI